MARTPVLAAGGIVLRGEKNPRIAVVRLRKRNEWVLPKGKLDEGETPRAAAEREVLEETGHDVSVHEFLGTLVYESGGRSKVVHYWRMAASGDAVHELMHDIKAVDWLPLDAALGRLSRGYERAFLANVGPIALQAAASAETTRRSGAKQPAPEKRRSRRAAPAPAAMPPSAPAPAISEPMPEVAAPDFAEIAQDAPVLVESGGVETKAVHAEAAEAGAAEAAVYSDQFQMVPQSAEIAEADSADSDHAITDRPARQGLVRKVRDWLRRAA
jgi:8-oxo-dGTP diphosphatase